jgi:FG-GAP-like repeat
VTLTDDAPGTATTTATGTANIGLAGQAVLTSATESVAINAPVAIFTDSNSGDLAGGFTATINWGDGTTTSGTVSGGSGSFTVSGLHIYADEMSAPLVATLVRTSDSAIATASGNVAVAEADALTPQAVAISASQNQAFSGTVATFTDSDTLNVAGDFTATINWGDGTTTAGTVAGGGGAFSVSGAHTYAAAGQESVKVTLSDDAPGTTTATATSTATVAGQPLSFIGVGDFDANTRSDIAWETNNGQADLWMNHSGTLTENQVPLGAMGTGTWSPYGVGDFNGDGKSDILWTSNTGQVAVWEMNGPNLIGFGVPAGQMGAGAWHVATIGDFNGDGKSDLLWVNSAGGHAAVWTMNSTVMSDFSLSNGAMGPEWSVLGTGDFNQDGRADVAWENTSGTVDIWEMNGPNLSGFDANVGTAPGRFAGVGHFTGAGGMGDRTSDIVWVDNTNHVTIWDMSNGHIANTVGLNGLDGSAWHLEGVGNFAGDANSDLLWINNTTGAVNIWEVSGSKVSEIPVSAPTGNPLTLKAGTQSSQSADNGASSDFVFTSEGAGISVSFAQPQASFVVTTVGGTSHPLAGT